MQRRSVVLETSARREQEDATRAKARGRRRGGARRIAPSPRRERSPRGGSRRRSGTSACGRRGRRGRRGSRTPPRGAGGRKGLFRARPGARRRARRVPAPISIPPRGPRWRFSAPGGTSRVSGRAPGPPSSSRPSERRGRKRSSARWPRSSERRARRTRAAASERPRRATAKTTTRLKGRRSTHSEKASSRGRTARPRPRPRSRLRRCHRWPRPRPWYQRRR